MQIVDPRTLLGRKATATLAGEHLLLINGRTVPASTGETFRSFDPATGATLADVAHASAADVDTAVTVAQAALAGPWAHLTPLARQALLLRLADLIEADIDHIAQIESIDSGKPVEYIKAVDIALSIDALRYNAGWTSKIGGETLPVSAPDMHVYTRHEPLGVVAAIVPWNFPLCQACFKIAPALAAGCTVVLKPAEQTPLSALILGRLAKEAGFPDGVLNVLPGLGETTGEALVRHPGVAKVAFTGSEPVGKHIARVAADSLKHVSFELGGKNPFIIFADADIEAAAQTAAIAGFFYSGQLCSAGSRILVERSAVDRVTQAVVDGTAALNLGHGLLSETTMGTLISREQRERVHGFVARARDAGIRVAAGGCVPPALDHGGSFYEPTVLLDADDNAEVVRDEIFGPVVVIQPFDDAEEAVQRATATSYGLASGIWTRDVGKAHKMAAAMQAGTVWVNTYNQFDAAAPWGGYKQSGYGRDNGPEGIEKFLQSKTVWVNCG